MDTTYNHQYSDFTGGISTLPLNKRRENQTDEILNCLVTEQGVKRRNPFKHFNSTTQSMDCLAFSFSRLDKSYLLILSPYTVSGSLSGVNFLLIDENGNDVTIDILPYHNTDDTVKTYFYYPNTIHIRDAFSISIIKDIIFIANKHKKPRIRKTKYPSASMEYYYGMWFKESTSLDGGYHYYITVEEDGVNDTDYHYKDTRTLAKFMGMVPKMSDYGNIVIGHWQEKKKVGIRDSNGNQATALIHRRINRFEDLPPKISEVKQQWYYHELNDGEKYYNIYEYNGYTLTWQLTERTREEPKLDEYGQKLVSPDTLSFTPPADYVQPWLIVEVTEGNSDDIGGYVVAYNNGEWEETAKWNDEVEINYTTFPLQLQYRSDTRFTLAYTPLREKHSDCNNPAFIQEHIQDMFYYKGRVGIATKNDISLSGVVTDDQLNFFKTTMRADIVSDAINYGISTSSTQEILMILPTNRGLFIISSDGIYANIFNGVVSQDTNNIGRLTIESIKHPIVMEDVLYYLSGGSLKAIIQGVPQRVGEHFRGKLDHIIDVAVHQPTRQLFFLDADKKTIWVVKILQTREGDYFSLGRWTRESNIFAIEVADDKLVLIQGNGIYASSLLYDSTSYIDDGTGDYTSSVILPKHIMHTRNGHNNIWYRYNYKRFKAVLGSGKIAVELHRNNTLMERIEEQEVNILQGHNQDTTIKLCSIGSESFDLHFAQSTLYVEQGNYNNI